MKKIIIANWKSNKNYQEVLQWFKDFNQLLSDFHVKHKLKNELEVVIAPPHPFVVLVRQQIAEYQLELQLGLQNLSQFGAGASTGEVCGLNYQGLGVSHAILGHSERRTKLQENNEIVAPKVEQAVESKMTPVICVDQDYIESQAEVLKSEHRQKSIVAYEPIEAISTNPNAASAKPKDVRPIIERCQNAFDNVPVLYGGSVDASNVKMYLNVSDGVLVGSASLDAEEFGKIIVNS